MPVAVGDNLGPYELLARIGAGGMGEVWKARDTRLNRVVAIKLSFDRFTDRFEREARAIAALNHPHICTLYDVGRQGDTDYLVMEFLEGSTLAQRLGEGRLDWDEAVRIAGQAADGLDAAHSRGIVHRDIKPANIWLTGRGAVKILDFGLARISRQTMQAGAGAAGPSEGISETTTEQLTRPGEVMGTLAYMSPEQMQGAEADARSDVFSLGVVIYEMLTGKRPFHGALLAALGDPARPVSQLNTAIPPEVDPVVARCMEKEPAKRYATAGELLADLRSFEERFGRSGVAAAQTRRRRARAAAAVAGILLAVFAAGGYWMVKRNAGIRWARQTALPQVLQAVQKNDYFAAFAAARQAERYIADDPILQGLWPQFSRVVTVETNPAGASVYRKEYRAVNAAWEYLGRSPLRDLRIPHGYSRWKIEAPGYQTLETAGDLIEAYRPQQQRTPGGTPPETLHFVLTRSGDQFEGMALVRAGSALLQIPGLEGYPPVDLPDYWIDRYEVSNRDFKRFIGAGGYRREEYWKQPFQRDGRTLTFQEAMPYFRDRTGRPGPAGWEISDYPAGQDDYPVVGVSWYEAAAYAEFMHKTLPTAYHWSFAASPRMSGWIVPLSNFGGSGLWPRPASRAVSPSGVYDMAGNAKEWCWNVSGNGRLILGGGYNEPAYMFNDWDSKPPFDRSANFGFRLMLPAANTTIPAAALGPVPTAVRDYRKEKPVSDAVFSILKTLYAYDFFKPELHAIHSHVFSILKTLYAYDAMPLNASATTIQETSDWWVERVSYRAGYGDERMVTFVATPKHGSPPFQTVVNFQGAETLHQRAPFTTESSFEFRRLQYLLKSGRALALPILKGTYDRGDDLAGDHPNMSALYRDHVIMWSKELRRTIDYIETRKDLDAARIAYYGFSWGGALGAMLPALEPRVKTLILEAGGLYAEKTLPEVDQINFAGRIKAPVLMVNGAYDHFFPVETSQKPLFRLLGAPAQDKRHVVVDSGHVMPEYIPEKETLEWLDRYLGAVKP